LPSETMIWQPEFTDKTLSRKPGAVQSDRNGRTLELTDDRSTESRGCGRSKIVELDFINLSPVVDELNTKLPESGLSGRESETGYY
ncbi:hypothetical protein, partial [Escherichia coli]|uniref:hypothetical protein n=2 Tax=Escherichia coli TaxID=562 RepID=UPI0021C97EB4